MRILPSQTQLPSKPFIRRHSPPAVEFSEYRDCLRWEFGFTCAFCLLHESDIVPGGSEGWAVMTIEHFELKATSPNSRNDYTNCYYCCRRCNRSRGIKPSQSNDGNMLSPSDKAWADHFRIESDRIVPVKGDADAKYTHDAYDLNSPDKVARRITRRETIVDCSSLQQDIADLSELLSAADSVKKSNPELCEKIILHSARVKRQIDQQRRDLERYRAIPHDAATECFCEPPVQLSLPEEFSKQITDLIGS